MRRTRWIAASVGFGTLLAATAATAQPNVELERRSKRLADRPAPVFTIGKDEGESWELLSNVTGVAFDKQDNLYVLDTGNARVLVFDRTGRYVRQFGKQGQGPGEFTVATALAVLSDGTIAVSDFGKTHVFAADGAFLRTIVEADGSLNLPGQGGFQASPRGGVVTRSNQMLRFTPGSEPQTGPRKAHLMHHPLSEGATAKAVYEFEVPGMGVVSRPSGGSGSFTFRSMGPPQFAPQFSFGVLPSGGLAISDGTEYALHITDAAGSIVRTVSRPDKPRRVTKADQEAARERMRRQLSGQGGGGGGARISMMVGGGGGSPQVSLGGPRGPAMPPEEIEEQVKALQFAEVMPLVQTIQTDPTGRIWVERTPDKVGDIGPIELVTAEGRYIGTINGLRRPAAVNTHGTLAAWIERNDLDVEQVIVRRLPDSWK